MAAAVHCAVRATAAAGGFSSFFIFDEFPDDQAHDKDQDCRNDNGGKVG